MKRTWRVIVVLCAVAMFAARAEAAPERGMFVSVIEEPPVLSSRAGIERLVDFAAKAGVTTIFIQVYRANRSWFPSTVADQSPYDECLRSVGEDPLAALIRQAHARGIAVHGWLNLLSLSTNTGAPLLKKYGPGILTRDRKKKEKLADYKIDSQYFLEPGDGRVRAELEKLVGELLSRYPELDGIQYDYIRYPDRHPFYGYTKANMARFKESAGVASIREEDPRWKDWKRRQVTELLELLVRKARALRPGIAVSTTACAPYVRAFQEAFQDWPLWLGSGLVDFVTLMSYSTEDAEFEKYVGEAAGKAADRARLNIAVGAYKFLRRPEGFARQFSFCESAGCGACVVFYYGNLAEAPAMEDFLLKRP